MDAGGGWLIPGPPKGLTQLRPRLCCVTKCLGKKAMAGVV